MTAVFGIVLAIGLAAFLLFAAFDIGAHQARFKAHSAFCQRETGGQCRKLNEKLWLSDKDGTPSYWVAP